MTKEEIVTALLDDMEMPYLQDWQARDIVDFVLKKYTEGLPTLKGWVARNEDGSLNFFSQEFGDGVPIYDRDCGMWGNATGENIGLPHQTGPFGDLTFQDVPIEVELIIKPL